MSNAPYANNAGAASESNVPLIPQESKPKDYEAAAAALMLNYGSGGTAPVRPHKTKKAKTKKEKDSKKKEYACTFSSAY